MSKSHNRSVLKSQFFLILLSLNILFLSDAAAKVKVRVYPNAQEANNACQAWADFLLNQIFSNFIFARCIANKDYPNYSGFQVLSREFGQDRDVLGGTIYVYRPPVINKYSSQQAALLACRDRTNTAQPIGRILQDCSQNKSKRQYILNYTINNPFTTASAISVGANPTLFTAINYYMWNKPSPPPKVKKTKIIYVNGMNTPSLREALLGLDEITNLYTSKVIGTDQLDQITSALIFNLQEDAISQFFEISRQRLSDRGMSEDIISNILFNNASIPEFLRDIYLLYIAAYDAQYSDPDKDNLVKEIRFSIGANSRILLIGYSQGNMYVNRGYDQLAVSERRSVGMLSIGTPTSSHRLPGNYVTSTNDFIANLVRTVFSGTLPGNTKNSDEYETFYDSDWKHHSLISSYIEGDITRTVIGEKMMGVVRQIPYP